MDKAQSVKGQTPTTERPSDGHPRREEDDNRPTSERATSAPLISTEARFYTTKAAVHGGDDDSLVSVSWRMSSSLQRQFFYSLLWLNLLYFIT